MQGWRTHNGQMLALPVENIDTDQMIPARFMSVPRQDGYAKFLFHDMRRNAAGHPDPDMPLNRYPEADILVTLRNFGCGSSREAAVYALVDAGFRAVIAPGFGDIFAGNAINNGLLPASVPTDTAKALITLLDGRAKPAGIDLKTRRITLGQTSFRFALDPTWLRKLINGWDDIDLTRNQSEKIAAFAANRRQTAPWVWPCV